MNNLSDSEIADTVLNGTADNTSRSSENKVEEPSEEHVSM